MVTGLTLPTPQRIDHAARHDWAATVRHLDSIGFDVGAYHLSVYRALLFLVVSAVVIVLGRAGSLVARHSFRRMKRLDPAQQVLGEKLVSISLWILLILMGIDFLNISLTALTVFSGALGLAIGFGLQKTFGNLISGIILLMDSSIKPGDVIGVGDGTRRTVGRVRRVGIRAVSVVTRDQIEFLIPNEQLMTSTVENWSHSARTVQFKAAIGVAYGTDLALAERLILAAAEQLPGLNEAHPPMVLLTALGERAIELEAQVWVADAEGGIGSLRSDLLKAVLASFAAHGVEIPYPLTDTRPPAAPPADSAASPR